MSIDSGASAATRPRQSVSGQCEAAGPALFSLGEGSGCEDKDVDNRLSRPVKPAGICLPVHDMQRNRCLSSGGFDLRRTDTIGDRPATAGCLLWR